MSIRRGSAVPHAAEKADCDMDTDDLSQRCSGQMEVEAILQWTLWKGT